MTFYMVFSFVICLQISFLFFLNFFRLFLFSIGFLLLVGCQHILCSHMIVEHLENKENMTFAYLNLPHIMKEEVIVVDLQNVGISIPKQFS